MWSQDVHTVTVQLNEMLFKTKGDNCLNVRSVVQSYTAVKCSYWENSKNK